MNRQAYQNKTSGSDSLERGVMPDAADMDSIKASLGREPYSDEEIDDMLKNATFECHKNGVDIIYINGVPFESQYYIRGRLRFCELLSMVSLYPLIPGTL